MPICFQQIDLCQAYFIALLGEYYGSTILAEQVDAVCQAYPWIKQNYLDRSITELEMIYALFDAGQERSAEQANLLSDKGDYDNAYLFYSQALAIFELKLGAKHTLHVRNRLKQFPLTFKLRRLLKPVVQWFN